MRDSASGSASTVSKSLARAPVPHPCRVRRMLLLCGGQCLPASVEPSIITRSLPSKLRTHDRDFKGKPGHGGY
jgi:hypothetical protein